MTVVQREKELRRHSDELSKLKYERLKRQKNLILQDKQLRSTLGLVSCQISPSAILSTQQLDDMERDVKKLDADKVRQTCYYLWDIQTCYYLLVLSLG